MKSRVFLLGGRDLEMLEIKNLLISNNEKFEDKNLLWGAKLSDYQTELEKYKDGNITLYGIELAIDITTPTNYIEVDHHGQNDDKPSSLEQIAEILGISLSREQKLIAANDSRYISGMKSLCATQKECEEIRAMDRKAQGIIQEDEDLAKASLNNSLCNKSNYIFSKTPKFSAVSDLAYYKFVNYTIYNDTKIVFYGYKKSNILEFLKAQNISELDCYYGGGEFGFVGIKDGILNQERIENLLKEFKKVENQEELYSYHTFMLPFTFKGSFDKKQNWDYKQFTIDEQKAYNEYIYFYKHVQDALYNNSEEENPKCISNYYEYYKQNGTYTINCKKGDFTLELDGISLRIFNTNVAILAFNLKNTEYPELESILAINDFGRRLYPQFLGEKYTSDTKNAILANCISLQFKDEEPISENFSNFDKLDFKNLETIPLLPKFIKKLIGENFENVDKIRPIIDDRMFVISWYGDNTFSESLRNEDYLYNPKWYEYVFVDGNGITINSSKMQTNLITQSTYDRWMDNPYGCTLYGVSRYSFVAVTNKSDFAKGVIVPHMQTMYFQMFTLLLAYRATIIKFADDIQDATTDDEKVSQKTKEVYSKYLKFLNKLYFKEITAQDQGIELYNQAMKVMDIEKYMNDLDNEINELHNYTNMIEEEKRTNLMDKISKLGSYLLAPALVTGFFGMNIISFEEISQACPWCFGVGAITIIIGSGFLMPWILVKMQKAKNAK